MKSISSLRIFTIGLALFSMLFGAGNLMYPIKVGMDSGEFTLWATLAFVLPQSCYHSPVLLALFYFMVIMFNFLNG